jgi:predicted CoA-binding protein
MRVVLIWASNNPDKFWNKILKDLVKKWHTVFPINPKEEKIELIECYKNLKTFLELKIDYDIINFVINPDIVLKILEVNKDDIFDKTIWCQPGACNDKVELFLEKNLFTNYITNSCIMIENIKD